MITIAAPASTTAAGDAAAAPLGAGMDEAAQIPFLELLLPAIARSRAVAGNQADVPGGPPTAGQAPGSAGRAANIGPVQRGEELPADAGNDLPDGSAATPPLAVATPAQGIAAQDALPEPALGLPDAGPAAERVAPGTASPMALVDGARGDALPSAELPDVAGSRQAQPALPAPKAGFGEVDASRVDRLATLRPGQADIEPPSTLAAVRAASVDGARLAASALQADGPGAASWHGFAQPPGSPAWNAALDGQVQLMLVRGERQALIRLHPQELGQLEIRIALGTERVDLNFTVQHAQVASAVQTHLPQLQQMLAAHGMSLGDASVFQQQAGRDGGDGSGRQAHGAWEALDGAAEREPIVWRPSHGGLIDAYV